MPASAGMTKGGRPGASLANSGVTVQGRDDAFQDDGWRHAGSRPGQRAVTGTEKGGPLSARPSLCDVLSGAPWGAAGHSGLSASPSASGVPIMALATKPALARTLVSIAWATCGLLRR